MLTFVLVQTLDLDIENRLRVDLDTGTPLHKLRQTNLVGQLNVAIRLTELRVIGIFFEVDQLVEIVGPLFLQRFIQQRGQRRVALFDPAARGNAVGDVMEFIRPQLVIFREQIFHHQVGVQRGHAVNRKAADHAHVRHANLFIVHHRQFRPYLLIAGPGFIDQRFKAIVNLFDDLHVARQQRFYQLLIPALERFRHQGVVGIREGFAGNRPGLVPAQLMLINQYAQQFRNRNRRVSIVKLDNFIIRQLRQLTARQVMATQNIGDRTGALEVLLHQTQFFTRLMVIVRIENFRQFFGVNALLFSTQEITVVEFGQVKRMRVFSLPQAQRLSHVVAVAQHRQIPGFPGNDECRNPLTAFGHCTAEANLHVQRFVVAEPRVAITPPVIRRFHLLTVSERLSEQAVLVVQAVAGRRLSHGGH